ncbi:hypothetical protein IAT38_000727 [Cryptococcus sp. DSM 104549]
MFNSPAPRATGTPRRTALRTREPSTASSVRSLRQGQTPSIFSDAPTPTAKNPRLAVVRGGSPTPSISTSIVDSRRERIGAAEDKDKVIWSKDERHVVTGLGNVPREVEALIARSDLTASSIAGSADATSGFATVSTPTTCIAWNYVKRTHSAPTTYTFQAPIPVYSDSTSSPALTALYTSSASSEPGIIVVSASGEIRFWENMSLALSNSSKYQTTQIDLAEDDFAKRIRKIDGHTFIVTTRSSQAFRVTVSSSGGRLSIGSTPLMRPGGMFGRLSNLIFGAREDKQGIRSVEQYGDSLYLLASRTIQKWTISGDGQKFVQEYDLYQTVGNALAQAGAVDLDLNDISAIDNDRLSVLVSYQTHQPGTSGRGAEGNYHAILHFTLPSRSQTVAIDGITRSSFRAHPNPNFPDSPSLLIPSGSTVAFVRFSHTILMTSLDPDSPYEEALVLKDHGHNAFIGADAVSVPQSSVVAIPAFGGPLSTEATSHSPASDSLARMSSATARLKSRMEQAVFYGNQEGNPLSFDLSGNVQGDVAEAAQAVSDEVVSSNSPYIPSIFELRPHLADRLNRLRELMKFIRRNGLLNLLPQASRRRLSQDAEKLKGALELWDYQNRLMDKLNTRGPKSLLSDAIQIYMQEHGIITDEDFVRAFFRTEVQNLDELLMLVLGRFSDGAQSAEQETQAEWVTEVNQIFINVVRAAAQYREEEATTYDIDREMPAVELWTASDALIDSMDYLYSATEQLIRERTRDLGSVIDEAPAPAALAIVGGDGGLKKEQVLQATLKRQMASLAAALCANMEDKCRVTVRRQIDDGADEQEGIRLKEKWDAMKPRVILPLVGIDRLSEAFELAEHHRDFPTLVSLSNDSSNGAARLQTYIEKFGEEFAFVLYQWYIDQGETYTLLTQDEVYRALVTRFFELNSYPELAWMHHIACGRYGYAAGSLVKVLGDERMSLLREKEIVGSIAKLASMTEINQRGENAARAQTYAHVNQELHLVKLQNTLRSLFSPLVTRTSTLEQSLAPQLKNLADRPAFRQLFIALSDSLVRGESLDLEGIIDVLTLKVNEERRDDPVTALKCLVVDQSLPKARSEAALIAIWRRIYIGDDWVTISNTSGRSEEGQRAKLRGTLAYRTFYAIETIPEMSPSVVVKPYDASIPPTIDEIAARFPAYSADDVASLGADYENEVGVLLGYVEEVALEERVREVMMLVKEDLARRESQDGDGDVVM